MLFKGEAREYHVPLPPAHRAIVIARRDALGNAGIRVLDGRALPYPLPRLEGEDCTVAVAEIGWTPGKATGRLTSTCRDRASETVDAVVLTDPEDPSQTVHQRLLVDALVKEVNGSLSLAVDGSASGLSFNRDAEAPFAIELPSAAGTHGASLQADLTSTRIAELPGRVELQRHGEETVKHQVPVVATFEGFFTRVTTNLRAVWDPFVPTVSAKLTAWFAPVTRALSATLRAVWDPYLQTVGGWVSATVGRWLSTVVGTTLSATVRTWVSTGVGTWVSTTLGKWLSTTVGQNVSAPVGTWVSTTVGKWLSATVGTWLSTNVCKWVSADVGTWVSTTVGKWLSANVGTWVSTNVGTWLSANVGAWVSANVGTWVSTSVGTWVSTTVGTWVSAWVGGFYATVSGWVNWVIGWFTSSVWVPSQLASGYASGQASAYASGTASCYASGTATGYASGTATGYATGSASSYASGSASGYASGQASKYTSGWAWGYASGAASKHASTQVTVPGKSDERTVSAKVTAPGQTKEETVSARVVVPGRTVEREVTKEVWVPGREVRRDVDVEVVIPGYTSAEVVQPLPLVITHRERMSTTFPLFADAPYEPIEEPSPHGGGGGQPSQVEQYVQLIDERDEGGPRDDGHGRRESLFRDALDRLAGNPYFDAHPDEAARLRSALFLAWIDGLTLPIDAQLVLEAEAGAVASERSYEVGELAGAGVGAQELFQALIGKELR